MAEIHYLRPPRPASPWEVISIDPDPDSHGYEVWAWSGSWSRGDVQRMWLGRRDTVLEASILAHAKAIQHNILDVADKSDGDAA